MVDMDFPSQKYTFKTSNSVKFNIFRQLVQGNEQEQLSCIEFLKDELLLAYNINIVSLLSLQNSTQCLRQALSLGIPQLIDCDGNSPFSNSLKFNSKNCSVLLEYQTHDSFKYV